MINLNNLTSRSKLRALIIAILSLAMASASLAGKASPILLTHYMPWFASKPISGAWGWHWTMNHYDPDTVVDGRPQIASHYMPLIGPYDSSDPDVLQYQVMLMKLAGIDGVIVDWYGNDNFADYQTNNRNTMALIPYIRKAGMHFAICYETHTVVTETQGGFLQQSDVVGHGQRLMQWMQTNFFSDPAYLKFGGRPVLLSFGDPYYNDTQWNQIFSVLPVRPLYFTEITIQEPTAAAGAFDWPLPAGGTQSGLAKQADFIHRSAAMTTAIACAFPGFDDIYSDAGVGQSWGHIGGDGGQTFTTTLTQALQSSAPVVQLVTWNDWGEGTQIEPSVEDGYQDLQIVQRERKQYLQPTFQADPAALRLPVDWYRLRKKYADDPAASKRLETVFGLVVAGRVDAANRVMASFQ